MTLEMQGDSNDVQPMDRIQASAQHNSRAKVNSNSNKSSLKSQLPTHNSQKKKVKGNMGLIVE